MIKLHYVIKDEKELLLDNNSRAMLNFGHTIGHAIESHYGYKKFKHGEAISIGMLSFNDLERIVTHFKKSLLKIYDTVLTDKKLIKKLTKDKKNFQNIINFSLIDKIGSSIFYKKLNKDKVHKILQHL